MGHSTRKLLAKSLSSSLKVFSAILVSYFCSSFFAIEFESYHVISFVTATMVVCFLRYGWKAAPAIFAALVSYYLYSGRDLSTALIFAISIPSVPYLVSSIYNQYRKRNRHGLKSSLLFTYFSLFGMLFPVLNATKSLAISYFTEKEHISAGFMAYSMLGNSITLLTLAPALMLLAALISMKSNNNYLRLDREIRLSTRSDVSFKLWFAFSLIPVLLGITFTNNIELTFICLAAFIIIASGIGKHGLLVPLAIGTFTSLVVLFINIDRVNTLLVLDSNFYGFLLIMLIIIMLSYLLATSVLRNHEIMQKQIRSERLDPYTGLLNITQLQEDIADKEGALLIYLDITPTLSKIGDIGHEGKAKLIQQLHKHLKNAHDVGHCYRPPFSLGILGFSTYSDGTDRNLHNLSDHLDNFQFYWNGTSISLVDPTLHCIRVTKDMNIKDLVSHLCDQPSLVDIRLNWLDIPLLEGRVDKLSYIQKVFKENQFELYCQPYLNLAEKSSQQHCFEVLVRVKHSDGNVLTPAEFFPLIGQFGLETRLDKWVVCNTFKMLNDSVDNWEEIEKCAINLTAKSLNNASLAKDLIAMADKFYIPLDKICFEITESAALQNEQQAIETISTLRKAGAKIALDDFGTGYASFSYLRRLPLDILKIDGEFVVDLPNSESDRLIVSSISVVAKELGLETVAEFVESPQHIDILEALNITYAQGYGVAKPRPLANFLTEICGR
ncbi:EAL domain-containing protein [Vibrio nomapromontoriensis]|uniref:EAL domain-containing protein n=1 Tax=Vibrio nomapromontoriensis TaxID=2910246 RepID=UPI003D0DB814